jgi:hypothetical protein
MERTAVTPRTVIAHLRFQLDRHGLPAALGLVLIACAIGLQFFGVVETRAQAVALRLEQTALRQRLVQQPHPEEAANKRLAGFYAGLPAASGALETIDIIHRAAQTRGVQLAQGEYRLAQESGARLLRYQITLPARASYPQLRAWLADVMNALPTAALDEISFRRDDVGSASVETRVRLTLFMRAD